jgi:hypothetical protein
MGTWEHITTEINGTTGNQPINTHLLETLLIVGLAYQCKDIVFRFIIEYGSLMDFGP